MMGQNNQSPEFNKLKNQLRTMFKLDNIDLDFGLYRIMNIKNKQVTEFIENTLLPSVKGILIESSTVNKEKLTQELEKFIAKSKSLGVDPDSTPKVQELKQKLRSSIDLKLCEEEVCSHLYKFFSRYYVDGDFLTVRRYKKDVYAIPYEGEEVKLHWTNSDQYYVKATENFSYYKINILDDKSALFKITQAKSELNNNKSNGGNEKRYYLDGDQPIDTADNQLILNFNYRDADCKTKQSEINDAIVKNLSTRPEIAEFGLLNLSQTKSNGNRTLLEKYLNEFTARRRSDYFIHKNLENFLVRELDFYIKNEMLFIDDLDDAVFSNDSGIIQKIKAVKDIGLKVIAFLAQLEEFQKKLWLKKKFAVASNYCISISELLTGANSDEVLEIIAANTAQRDEWVKLFEIDQANSDLVNVGYTEPLTVDFLKANDKLPVDTKFFTRAEKYKILGSIESLDQHTDGILIHSENFQALNLLQERFADSVKYIYIDPRFYLGENPNYLYKMDYEDSTWLTMLENGMQIAKNLLSNDGSMMVRCTHDGNMFIRLLMEGVFDKKNFRNEIIVRRDEETKGDFNKQFKGLKSITVNYDNLYWFSKSADSRFDRFMKKPKASQAEAHWHSFWKAEDRKNLRYPILGIDLRPHRGQWMWRKERAEQAVKNYEEFLQVHKSTGISLESYWQEKQESYESVHGHKLEFIRRDGDGYSSIKYWIPPRHELMADNNWLDIKGSANKWGFKTENSEELLKRNIETLTDEGDYVLDYFSGSGTTAAVAHKTNRKWIAVEMGHHCEHITKLRLLKVLYGEKSGITKEVNWTGGGCFKYLELEQFEDSLDNLQLENSTELDLIVGENADFNEEYILKYMLDLETRNSNSLLTSDGFADPFSYTLQINRNERVEIGNVDLIETFNWLLGLKVEKMECNPIGTINVLGVNPAGETCLIIWRNLQAVSNDQLNKWFEKDYLAEAEEIDAIYVNGDCNLASVKPDTHRWSVRLTEAAFHQLMFAEQRL